MIDMVDTEARLDMDVCNQLVVWTSDKKGAIVRNEGHTAVVWEMTGRSQFVLDITQMCYEQLRHYCREQHMQFGDISLPTIYEYSMRDHRRSMMSMITPEDLDLKATMIVNLNDTPSHEGGVVTLDGLGLDHQELPTGVGGTAIFPAYFRYEISQVNAGSLYLLRVCAVGKGWR